MACDAGCVSILYLTFHYVLKTTKRGYIDPKGIGLIYIYISVRVCVCVCVCVFVRAPVHGDL